MALFSRPPQEVARAAAVETWSRGAFEAETLAGDLQAVHVPGRTPRLLPAFAIDFVLGCEAFQPLAEHVRQYASMHHWSSLERAELERLLPVLAEDGLLISSETVRRRLKGMHGEAGQITALGIPTGGPRQALVERALRSFADHIRRHERTVQVHVADSSSDPQQTERLRERLRSLRIDLRISMAGEEEKRAFIEELAKVGACAPSEGEFALLDPLRTGFVCGGNRNAYLLHEAGHMLASVDDDVVCRLAHAPEPAADGSALFARQDPFARWLYVSQEEAAALAEVDGDFLALHETLLGRGPGNLSLEPLSFAQAGDPLVRRILENDCRIRATFTGHYGDPGIPTSAYYLYYEGRNRERLCASESHYRAVLGSRAVGGFAPVTMLGDASISPGMAMGLDHRELLPPFFPVLHAEDFSYGAALWQSRPEAVLAHTPWGVWHAPPPGKAILQPREFGPGRRAAFFEFAHLLRRLLFAVRLPATAPVETRLALLGRALQELGDMAPADFRDRLVQHALEEVGGRVRHLSKQLDECAEAPQFWRADAEHLLRELTAAVEDEEVDIPLDLQSHREPTETRQLMQKLLGRYGALLQAWPAMVAATRALREKGITLLQPV